MLNNEKKHAMSIPINFDWFSFIIWMKKLWKIDTWLTGLSKIKCIDCINWIRSSNCGVWENDSICSKKLFAPEAMSSSHWAGMGWFIENMVDQVLVFLALNLYQVSTLYFSYLFWKVLNTPKLSFTIKFKFSVSY